jgi:hypothetical protein
MKYFIIAFIIPVLNFADDNPYFFDAKSYVQDRLDKYYWIKSLHLEACPELDDPNYLYDSIYQYGYIIGSIDAYRNMENIID